ncbi:MAG: sugar-binding protein [Verrucomicrobiae bacterium]|nr:sugar-binding protein [Verrucomicrobiae bacterium]
MKKTKTNCNAWRLIEAAWLFFILTANLHAEIKGLAAYWPMRNGVGEILEDQSGNGFDGKTHGTTWTPEKGGGALYFDGQKAFVDCGYHEALNFKDSLTLEMWLCPEKQSGPNRRIISNCDAGNGKPNGYVYSLYLGDEQLQFLLSNGKTVSILAVPFETEKRQHVAATWDGFFMKIFVNGEKRATRPFSGTLNRQNNQRGLFIGGMKGTAFFKGTIDEVKLYNCALREEIIKQNYLSQLVQTVEKTPKTPKPPILDGNLADEAWQNALKLSPFMVFKSGKPAKKQGEAFVCYDDHYFYLAFKFQEPEPGKTRKIQIGHDSPVWADDCVEIFLDPNPANSDYFHFGANILGMKAEEKCAKNLTYRDLKWNASWEIVTKTGKDCWQGEARIPLAGMGISIPPPAGSLWRLSVNRGEKQLKENSGWPDGRFHSPFHFGKIILESYRANLALELKQIKDAIVECGKIQHPRSTSTPSGENYPAELEKEGSFIFKIENKINGMSGDIDRKDWFFLSNLLQTHEKKLSSLAVKIKSRQLYRKLKSEFPKYDENERKKFQEELFALLDLSEKVSLEEHDSLLGELKLCFFQIQHSAPLLIWEKNPWQALPASPLPNPDIPECREIKLAMGINAHKNASLVLANITPKEMRVNISVKTPGVSVVVREAFPVKCFNGMISHDALPLVETLRIPPLGSREIWVCANSRGAKPGDYVAKLILSPENFSACAVNLKIKVNPIELPAKASEVPLFTGVWDYSDYYRSDPELLRAIIDDLFAHHITCHFIPPETVPYPKFNSSGEMSTDYSRLDNLLSFYKIERPKMFAFPGLNCKAFGKNTLDEEWRKNFSRWLPDFVAQLKKRGLDHNHFFLQLMDETTSEKHRRLAACVKSIDPNIRIFVNPTAHSTYEEIVQFAPYVDFWAPYFFFFEKNSKIHDLLRKKGDGYWNYANPPGGVPKLNSPYTDYRMIPWLTWRDGMRGTGFWVYLRYPDISWRENEIESIPYFLQDGKMCRRGDKACWDVVYLRKYAPPEVSQKEAVIPSKRWEAWREGMEDYMYLDILQKALAQAETKNTEPSLIREGQTLLKDEAAKTATEKQDLELADKTIERAMTLIEKLLYPGKKNQHAPD